MRAESALAGRANLVSWICQLAAAAIMAQTLYFKFTGAPESVYIFSTLGAEPWGRLGSGALELVAAVLLAVPRTAVFGALLGVGLMTGAIGAHVTRLGIEVQGDGGLLFVLALATFLASATVAVLRRRQIWSRIP
jgi:hypothetical protein